MFMFNPIFWEFAVNHVVFLINAIPTPLLDNITPHEKLFGKPVGDPTSTRD